MPRNPAILTSQTRISDYLAISLVYAVIPYEKVKIALSKTGKNRFRFGHLPREILPFYIVVMALFRDCSLEEVQRIFFEGTTWTMKSSRLINSDRVRAQPIGKSAISQARTRLGWEPMKALFNIVVRSEAGVSDTAARYQKRFLVSLSGGTVETVNNLENLRAFGTPGSEREGSPSPQIKFVSLVEHGSRLIFDAEVGSCATAEFSLAKGVVHSLHEGMLCFASKAFFNLDLWQEASKTGAGLVWEVGSEVNFSALVSVSAPYSPT